MQTPIAPRYFRGLIKGVAVTAFLLSFSASNALSQNNAAPEPVKHAPPASVAGDSLSVAPPLATDLSPAFKRSDVKKALLKVGDWQLQRAQSNFNKDWTYAALYVGFMAVPSSVAGSRYQDAMLAMAKKFDWQPGPRPTHADDQAITQTYIQLYMKYHDPQMIAPTRKRFDAMMKVPDNPTKPLWWWCDALFMAPPAFAELTKATGDPSYINFADHEWWITSSKLYDPVQHLYYRDARYLDKHEANGKSLFWSRGNGWVMAGIAHMLEYMPKDDPMRPKYIQQFQQMAAAIAPLQGSDGLWRSGLLDAEAYPLPENSGSAFITYALAYGIKNHLIDKKQYLPVVKKAWAGLLSHVYQDGRLGCIQPVGAAPDAFSATSSYVYGVGAYLLAGSEIYQLSH